MENNDPVEEEYADRYPPLITATQAAEIAHRPLTTIYSWSMAGKFKEFKSKQGRQILLERDRFVRFLRG